MLHSILLHVYSTLTHHTTVRFHLGLDSYNAVILLKCLEKMAKSKGTTILFSLHHPNLLMFNMIDHIILLNEGRCMLHGAVNKIPNILKDHGLSVPDLANPADWMIEIS